MSIFSFDPEEQCLNCETFKCCASCRDDENCEDYVECDQECDGEFVQCDREPCSEHNCTCDWPWRLE